MKPSEKRLLIALGAVLFLMANFIGLKFLLARESRAKSQGEELKSRMRVITESKKSEEEALRKLEWLNKNLQRYKDIDQRDNDLVDFVQGLAKKTDLTLKNPSALDPKVEDGFIKSKFTGEVSGSWTNFLEFVYYLQDTSQFRRVTSLRISSRKSEDQTGASTLVGKLEIEKWWDPESDAALAEAAEAEAEKNPEAEPSAPLTNNNTGEHLAPVAVETPGTAPTAPPPPAPAPTPPNSTPPATPNPPQSTSVSTNNSTEL